jgi:hypothetical protein
MRLLVQSAMIFFGTLLAAALLALGEPAAVPGPGTATHGLWHELSVLALAAR